MLPGASAAEAGPASWVPPRGRKGPKWLVLSPMTWKWRDSQPCCKMAAAGGGWRARGKDHQQCQGAIIQAMSVGGSVPAHTSNPASQQGLTCVAAHCMPLARLQLLLSV